MFHGMSINRAIPRGGGKRLREWFEHRPIENHRTAKTKHEIKFGREISLRYAIEYVEQRAMHQFPVVSLAQPMMHVLNHAEVFRGMTVAKRVAHAE
jgi:hypothetical protein